jgi:hypothetical protein
MTRLTAVSSRLAVLAACSFCALPAISHAADGTISFLGAIVEPPYEVRVAAAVSSSTNATSTSNADAEISFSSSANLSASVRADGLGPSAVSVRCTGATRVSPQSCRLGPRGGAISIAALPSAAIHVAHGAVLTVAYD